MTLKNINVQNYIDLATTWALSYMPKVIGALFVLWVGFKIVNIIGKIIDKALKLKKIDETVEAFLVSLFKNILKALVFVTAIGIIWVETSSFVALFATVDLAVGMALSGTLSHFASGIMILLFKPYKVGDMIETAGHFGKVKEVQIFNTILETVDAKTIIIPNSEAIGSSIINLSMVNKKSRSLCLNLV
jgi:small conductance mechanosensitive channel